MIKTTPFEMVFIIRDGMLLSYARTIFLYLVLIVTVRLLGKRQIGEMEPTEFVVTMLVSNLASIPMQDAGIPLYTGLMPILTVLGLELILSAACMRFVKFRKLLCGKPVILINNGRILRENLRRTRITLDELTEMLRQKDVLRPETVQYAILETNGTLSVFPFPKFKPASATDAGIKLKQQSLPYTLIADGYLFEENLKISCRDGRWLQKLLEEHHCQQQDVFLLTVDDAGQIFFLKKEEAQ